MKRLLGRVLLVLVLLGAAAGAVAIWNENQIPPPRNVLVLYGNVDIRQVELAFFGTERVAELLVEEGDSVCKGQPLGRLETERLEQRVALAEAQRDSQAQVVKRLEAGTRPEEIRKAEADLEAARTQLADAGRTHRRLAELSPRGAVSQEQTDDARAALESAEAQMKAAQAQLDLARAGSRQEDVTAARAMLRAQDAELELARRDLLDAQLLAPSNGVIQDRLLEVGDMASPVKPAFTLALTTPVWVRTYIDEPDLGKIAPGMIARVRTDSSDEPYDGWVGFISPTAEFTPKSVETAELRTQLVYQVRVYVENTRNQLRLGMPATVLLPLDQTSARIKSPNTAQETGG